ncbi:hypothetical protein HY991_01195 [Candidatus Micrarchaeota archaeon]|nr:hypothetical protein [Candidatus Micrarchaeota archaeon]
MGFFDLFSKRRDSPEAFYALDSKIFPLRLLSHKNDSVDLVITVKNVFDRSLLTSVLVRVPKSLGFDQTALTSHKEIRLGELPPNESKTLKIPVFSTQRTEPGTYKVRISVVSHYRDYGYVLNEVSKTTALRAV